MATCANCGTIYSEERNRCPNCSSPLMRLPDNTYDQEYWHDNGYDGDTYDGAPGIAQDMYEEQDDGKDYSPPPRRYSPADEPAYIYSTPRDRFVMSVSSFLGSIVLMSIPLIGFLIQIIWAVGGAKNQNKRNLAKAYIILTVIVTLLTTAAAIVLYGLLEPYINDFMALLESM